MEDGEENLETVDPDAEPYGANEVYEDGPMVSEGDANVEESSAGGSFVPESCEPEGVGSGPEVEDEAEENIISSVLSVKSTNSDASDVSSTVDHDSVQSCEDTLLGSDSGDECGNVCEKLQKPMPVDPSDLFGSSSNSSHLSSPVTNDITCSLEPDRSTCSEVDDGADRVNSVISDSEQEEENVESVVESKREPASALWPVLSFETRTETEMDNILQEDQFEDADNSRGVTESSELGVSGNETNFACVDGDSVSRTECEDVSKAANIKDDSVTSIKSEWEKSSSFDEEACHNGGSISRDSMLSDEKQECHLSVTPTSPVDRNSDFGEDSNECSNKQICDNAEQVDFKGGLFEKKATVLRVDGSENLSLSNVAGVGDPFSGNDGVETPGENTDKVDSVNEVCDQELPEEETVNSEVCDQELPEEETVNSEVCDQELPEEETVNSEVCDQELPEEETVNSEVCDQELPEEETVNSEVWDDEIKEKTLSENSSENQCNGDIDSHEHSQSEEMDWTASTETSNLVQEPVEEPEETVTGSKRKQSCDGADEQKNSISGDNSCPAATKMFKMDHNVAQLNNQQTPADKGCPIREPQVCSQQSVEGNALFPGNIQGSSHLTEYAQYLGLQPTIKFKCVRCGEKSFPSMVDLKTHQYACLKNHTASQPSPALSNNPPFQTSSTNFRITRKVYLCSVCGTYYENWNLFLHMREVHKRHICLFCLGMFSQAERLAAHLVSKHSIVEGQFASAEEYRMSCKGSVFLMCCSCEKVFSEEDSFSNHPCKEKSGTSVATSGSNSLVSKTSQGINPSHQSATAAFTERSKITSKQFADIGGLARSVNSRPVENKLGKVTSMKGKSQTSQAGFSGFDLSGFGSGNFTESGPSGKVNPARPKQILKVKIPIQPKKQEMISVLSSQGPPATPVALSSSAAPNDNQPPVGSIAPNSDVGSIQTLGSTAHSEMYPEEGSKSDTLLSSQLATDGNCMSNLDRTINAVARGITSEALEWQQRKDEEMREVEEPTKLLSLDGAAKSDSDSDGESMNGYPSEENLNCVGSPEENGTDPTHEPEKPASPSLVQAPEPMEVDHTPPELLHNADEELSDMQPEQTAQLSEAVPQEPTPLVAEEALQQSSSPVPPSSPVVTTPTRTEPTPAEEESDLDTDDSDKLSLVVDETASGAENEVKTVPEEAEGGQMEPQHEPEIPTIQEELQPDQEQILNEVPSEKMTEIPLAGEEVPLTEVTIEEGIEDISVQSLLKECVKTLSYSCVYCSHARRIAVNGKQLALHTLAEHRFSPIGGTDEEEPSPTSRFISKLKDSLHALQDMFFNTDTYDSTDKNSCVPYDRTYECFQCHFFTKSHKELYIHNRKMHQKTILLCIMCKSNFYSYSELLCHLCPGIYIPQCNISFHCCMCEVDSLPSAFRLMVHLRKRHHTCDVCLEITDDQQKLSSHVWKHKLHHLCYRCGIAYRNKPDITNHLFWKHGTESVLCKKCLQKKWPHVYHFCVPPATFTCEECNSLFTRAVSLRVHKRLHSGEQPHPCTECEEKFISKKLLVKHTQIHRTPPPEEAVPSEGDATVDDTQSREESTTKGNKLHADMNNVNCGGGEDNKKAKGDVSDTEKETAEDSERDRKHGAKKKKHKEKEEQKQKKVVDVYDLPPLNLSSESDSSDEDEKKDQTSANALAPVAPVEPVPPDGPAPVQVEESQAEVVDGIWDKFQSYKASLEKLETAETLAKIATPVETPEDVNKSMFKIIMMDHDYCLPENSEKPNDSVPAAGVSQDSEKQQEPSTDPANIVKSDLENTVREENPPSTPPHSKDDSKSILSSESPTKKKRSPKKKIRRRSSSSSSNSSSGSDSSSCSCGTNCSCSSSSSSDSSSSSSDSDSSSSEGKRRALERRESRKEKSLEKKKEDDDKGDIPIASPSTPAAMGHQPVEEPHIDVTEPEPAFRESDLDTTETDTDEDFYDECPQKLPDESQVEKRNLLLLASVAPLNNGAVSPNQVLSQQNEQLEEPLEPEAQPQQQLLVPSLNPAAVTGKKRTKKRKKKQTSRFHPKLTHKQPQLPEMPAATLTHDLSAVSQSHSPERFTSFYYPQSAPSPVSPAVQNYSIMTPPFQQSTPMTSAKKPIVSKLSREFVTNAGSGSETEGRTKRKRMPNKFYGYSSDEETEEHHHTTVHKWRKTESSTSQPSAATRPLVPTLTLKHTFLPAPEVVQPSVQPNKLVASKTDSDSESESKRVTSSSSSSDSDDDAMHISEVPVAGHVNSAVSGDIPVRESNDNLYCYCQCPYDEVSEMIACDGKNCAIEWFHFECVGIMVPPKGQWYCPDCRKHMTNYLGSE